MILCSAVMALGTSIGGYRIIKSVGMDMVSLEKYQGFAADLAGAGCLLISSVSGLPVSTTHTKTTAIMGVGAAKAPFLGQMVGRQGHGDDLGPHLSGLRPDRLFDGASVCYDLLIRPVLTGKRRRGPPGRSRVLRIHHGKDRE